MNGNGKSDRPILPKKPSNKAVGAPVAAEGVEGRGLAKGNPRQSPRTRTQRRRALMLKLERIRQVAKQRKGERFTSQGDLGVGGGPSRLNAISHEWLRISPPPARGVVRFYPNLDQRLRVTT